MPWPAAGIAARPMPRPQDAAFQRGTRLKLAPNRLDKRNDNVAHAVSLDQLDAFLSHSRQRADLQEKLHRGVDLDSFLALARDAGFAVQENDVIAAQQRAEADLSDAELQRRAGEEARRMRNFIYG